MASILPENDYICITSDQSLGQRSSKDNNEECEGGTTGVCLICNLSCSGTQKIVNSVPFLSTSSSSLLSKDLHVYFLLKHILQLPSELLENFLAHCPNPQDWVKVCRKCEDSYVNKCKTIFRKLLDLQRKFVVAKQELIEVIKKSLQSEQGTSPENGSQEFILNIGKETRYFVGRYDYGCFNTSEIFAGDLKASEKLASQKEFNGRADFSQFTNKLTHPNQSEAKQKHFDVEFKKEPSSPTSHENYESCDDRLEHDLSDNSHGETQKADLEDAQWKSNSMGEEDEKDKPWTDGRTKPSSGTFPKTSSLKRRRFGSVSSIKTKLTNTKGDFKCHLCTTSFNSSTQLRLHQIRSHKTNFYECTKCPWKSLTAFQLTIHMKGKHGNQKDLLDLTCLSCQRTFSCKQTLKLHIAAFHKPIDTRVKFQCDNCGKEFVSKANFFNHMGAVHGVKDHLKFTCSFEGCGRSFFKKSQLLDHEDIHKLPQYTCEVCGQAFKTKVSLTRHSVQHTVEGGKPFQCDLCPARFKRKDNLTSHLKKLHGASRGQWSQSDQQSRRSERSLFKCTQCNLTFASEIGMLRHIQSAHGSSKQQVENETEAGTFESFAEESMMELVKIEKLKCEQCTASFNSESMLRRHQIRVHGTNLFECTQCGWKTIQASLLDDHMEGQHKETYKIQDMKMLPSFEEVPILKTGCSFNASTVEMPATDEHKCDICKTVFGSKSRLRRHVKRMHSSSYDISEGKGGKKRGRPPGLRTYQCPDCDTNFPRIVALQKHRRIVHGVKNTEVQIVPPCPICGVVLGRRDYLQRHIEEVHESRFEMCCELCGKILKRPNYIKLHMRKMHNIGDFEIPKVPCTVPGCGKMFEDKGYLKKHILCTHEGQRRFQCDHCGKRWLTKTHLKRHVQTVHTNKKSKPFKCDICGKGFAGSEYIKQHKRFKHQISNEVAKI